MKLIRLTAVAAVMAAASPAFADDAACIQSYESAQLLRKASKIREARAEAMKCAADTCPAILIKDCQKWQTELEATLPSAVFEVKSATGESLSNVKVTANGQPLVDKIDGSPVIVEAGSVTFHFESTDGRGKPADQTVTIKDGEKGHKVSVTLGAPASAGVTIAGLTDDRPIPIPAIVFGAAGVVLAGVGTVFAIAGSSAESDLDSCKPHCRPDDINSVSTKYAFADILFSAGAVSLVAAAYLFITRPHPSAAPTASRRKTSFALEF